MGQMPHFWVSFGLILLIKEGEALEANRRTLRRCKQRSVKGTVCKNIGGVIY